MDLDLNQTVCFVFALNDYLVVFGVYVRKWGSLIIFIEDSLVILGLLVIFIGGDCIGVFMEFPKVC